MAAKFCHEAAYYWYGMNTKFMTITQQCYIPTRIEVMPSQRKLTSILRLLKECKMEKYSLSTSGQTL